MSKVFKFIICAIILCLFPSPIAYSSSTPNCTYHYQCSSWVECSSHKAICVQKLCYLYMNTGFPPLLLEISSQASIMISEYADIPRFCDFPFQNMLISYDSGYGGFGSGW
ncbi:hypothetical protein P8452_56175 [Trifolium repens]|nr:hypothetical protein P8452_56175 [Trifolium repens]